jgi:hypothetical protein
VYKVKPADAPSKIAANVNWIGIIAALEDVDTDCAWGSLGALGEGVDVHVLASVMIMMFCDQGHKNSTYAENLHLKSQSPRIRRPRESLMTLLMLVTDTSNKT